MGACVVICRTAKPKARKGRILFINAVDEVTRERAQSFLTDDHIERIVKAYERFKDEPGFTCVATLEGIRAKDGNLCLPLYIASGKANGSSDTEASGTGKPDLAGVLAAWIKSSGDVRRPLSSILEGNS
jgi:type I restriction enzyme M protein